MTGLSWLLVAAGASAHATEFQLDTDTPDALCPELSMTREAVRQRLGQLETEAGAHWRGSYSTVHDPSGRHGDYVRLIIRDAEGKEHLDRELPLKGESCDTLAQAIALVVDGFFRELTQSSERNAVQATGTQQQPTAPTSKLSGAPLVVPQTSQAGSQRNVSSPAAGTNQSFEGGLTFAAGYESVPSAPALDVGGFLKPTRHWQLQLRAALPLSSAHESEEVGRAALYPVPLRLSFSYVVQTSRNLQWFLGPQALFVVEHATTQGVPNGHSGWRTSLGLGAQTGIAYWLTASVALAGSGSVDQVFYESRKFLMYQHPVLELAGTRVSGNLGL